VIPFVGSKSLFIPFVVYCPLPASENDAGKFRSRLQFWQKNPWCKLKDNNKGVALGQMLNISLAFGRASEHALLLDRSWRFWHGNHLRVPEMNILRHIVILPPKRKY
jgi:hypothetical protein